jgi:hypothetical protein
MALHVANDDDLKEHTMWVNCRIVRNHISSCTMFLEFEEIYAKKGCCLSRKHFFKKSIKWEWNHLIRMKKYLATKLHSYFYSLARTIAHSVKQRKLKLYQAREKLSRYRGKHPITRGNRSTSWRNTTECAVEVNLRYTR